MISEERLKRFWEWCGFVKRLDLRFRYQLVLGWRCPDDETCTNLPELTLDSLFEWAVPKVLSSKRSVELVCRTCGSLDGRYQARIGTPTAFCEQGDLISVVEQDPAIAVFLAIEKLIEEIG